MKYEAIKETNFEFDNKTDFYRGKVRDVYSYKDDYLLMVVSDRISAFDIILPNPIPYKGEILNIIAAKFLKLTEDIVPNWLISTPDPSMSFGYKCKPFPVEMVIRGYLVGHAWREYKAGKREICGAKMPDGMVENQKFEKPIITPTTKENQGHDEDISPEEIVKQGLMSAEEYRKVEQLTYKLFERGSEYAKKRGIILVDTKYEFGTYNGETYLIDEIHTPDSSRYFYADNYAENFEKGLPQNQLSKEFVREWLMEKGFMGEKGDVIPEMTEEVVNMIMNRYFELYEKVVGEKFILSDRNNLNRRMQENIDSIKY